MSSPISSLPHDGLLLKLVCSLITECMSFYRGIFRIFNYFPKVRMYDVYI